MCPITSWPHCIHNWDLSADKDFINAEMETEKAIQCTLATPAIRGMFSSQLSASDVVLRFFLSSTRGLLLTMLRLSIPYGPRNPLLLGLK